MALLKAGDLLRQGLHPLLNGGDEIKSGASLRKLRVDCRFDLIHVAFDLVELTSLHVLVKLAQHGLDDGHIAARSKVALDSFRQRLYKRPQPGNLAAGGSVQRALVELGAAKKLSVRVDRRRILRWPSKDKCTVA